MPTYTGRLTVNVNGVPRRRAVATQLGATTITVGTVTETSVAVSWSVVFGAPGYLSGLGTSAGTVSTATTRTFTGLQPGTTYQIYVEPQGGPRTTISVTTQAVVVPPVGPTVKPGELAGADAGTSLNYAIPVGAIFVAADGNDANPGTESAPVKGATRANALCPTNGTIMLRGGIYDWGVAVPAGGSGYSVSAVYACASITKAGAKVQPYPGEQVIFDGSEVYTGRTQAGAVWSKNIVLTHDRGPTDAYGGLDNDTRGLGWWWIRDQRWHDAVIAAVQPQINSGAITSLQAEQQAQMFPLASWPEQVYIDGVQQTQVATLGEVTAGKFYVAGTTGGSNGVLFTSSAYHLGTDPTGKEVRIAVRATCIAAAAAGVTLRGFTVRRFANSNSQGGAVKVRSNTGCTLEQVHVEDVATVGVEYFNADNTTARKVTATRCGILGFKSHLSYNLLYDECGGTYNNASRFAWAPVSGGAKITAARGVKFLDCDFSYNWTKGIWFDVSCYDTDIVNTNTSWNEQFGIVFEIGAKFRLVNTNMSNNGKDGLLWHDTNDGVVWNCVVKGNGRLRNLVYDSANIRNFRVFQDARRQYDDPTTFGTYQGYGRDPRQPVPDPTLNNWVIIKMGIANTIFDHGNLQFGYYAIEDLQKNEGHSRPLSMYGLTANGNLFVRASATNPSLVFMAPQSGATHQENISTLARWRTVSGQDTQSVEVLGATQTDANGYLTTAALSQYGPTGPANPAVPLPADIAALIGVPAGLRQVGIIPIPA